jgi:hypothetical protein
MYVIPFTVVVDPLVGDTGNDIYYPIIIYLCA